MGRFLPNRIVLHGASALALTVCNLTLHPMKRNQALRTAVGMGGFFVRHLIAVLVTVVVPCLLWTITYLALLLWAVFTNSDIGGPLAYPAGIIVIIVAATVASFVLLLPSTALAEWLAKRRGLPILVQIPISIGILGSLCFILVAVAASVDTAPSMPGAAAVFGVLFASNLLPLGLYWWTAQSGPLLFSLWKLTRKNQEDF